jgi:hypothetical protein
VPTIINVSSAEQAQIRNAITRMIARLGEITDTELRDCIREKATGDGAVINHSELRPGNERALGFTDWRVIGPFVVWKSDDINVSLNNHARLPPRELESTLMHEWAHACCWDHGDGKGVPL